jgi:hypothetical protein
MYEKSQEQLHSAEDELINMKEYLNEVLKEVANVKRHGKDNANTNTT